MTLALVGAIEAGGTKFVVAVAQPGGAILERVRLPTEAPGQTMPQVVAFFRAAAARHGPLGGIGVGSFGPIGTDPGAAGYGTILHTPKPGWAGTNYRDWLAPLGLPVAVDTDVNAAALGEWLAGAGQGVDTLAYTTVGTGIGTGVIHRGRPLGGFGHYEAGHIRVAHDRLRDPFGGVCPYHGDCLEGLASGAAIMARHGTGLDRLADPAEAIALVGGYLADLAVNLVLLHMPDRLIFGGGVMKAPGLIATLRRETERRLGGYLVHPRLDPGLERYIVGPGLGDLAGITGAIELGCRAAREAGGPG
ncbi:ROK family protein [Novosphingobium bradum]|uniref:ROK family protein n=1 Tax=Novosphingobium bradum TaxID=1737444 RepID=A0ABV7ISL5_9SPHN